MALLHDRPLATILIVLLSGFALFALLSTPWRIGLTTALILLWLTLALVKRKRLRRIVHIACATALIAFALSAAFFAYFFADRRFEGQSVEVKGYLSEVYYSDGMYTIGRICATSVNGAPLSRYTFDFCIEGLSHRPLGVGEEVTLFGTLSAVPEDDRIYAIGQGISAELTVTDLTLTGRSRPLRQALYELRTATSAFIVDRLGDEAGGLLTALLIGDRHRLSADLSLAFRRAGITHILALSGMHLSILCFALFRILRVLGLRKTWRSALVCPAVIAYLLLTGVPSSLLRAAVMLLITSVLFLLRQSHDSLTTLLVSVTLIVLAQPFAIFDIALMLSALSTLGLLVAARLRSVRRLRGVRRLAMGIVYSCVLSVGALGASLLLSVFTFSSLSLLSIPATLLFGLLIPWFMYLSLIALLLPTALPIKAGMTVVAQALGDLCRLITEGRYSLLDASFPLVRLLCVIFTVALILTLVCRIKHLRAAFSCVLALFLSVYLGAFALTRAQALDTRVIYAEDADREAMLLISDEQSMLVDIGRGGIPFSSVLLKFLAEEHVTYLDTYLLTRYTHLHGTCVSAVLSSVRCSTVLAPQPISEEEHLLARELADVCEAGGVTLVLYDRASIHTVGELVLRTPYNTLENEKSHVWLTVEGKGTRITYFSRGSIDDITKTAATELVAQSDVCLFGVCGYQNEYVWDVLPGERMSTCILADERISVRRDVLDVYQERGVQLVLSPQRATLIH